MSRSESLEREVRIRCLSSTIARCEDREDLVEGGGVRVWGFGCFIVVVCAMEMQMGERVK